MIVWGPPPIFGVDLVRREGGHYHLTGHFIGSVITISYEVQFQVCGTPYHRLETFSRGAPALSLAHDAKLGRYRFARRSLHAL